MKVILNLNLLLDQKDKDIITATNIVIIKKYQLKYSFIQYLPANFFLRLFTDPGTTLKLLSNLKLKTVFF